MLEDPQPMLRCLRPPEPHARPPPLPPPAKPLGRRLAPRGPPSAAHFGDPSKARTPRSRAWKNKAPPADSSPRPRPPRSKARLVATSLGSPAMPSLSEQRQGQSRWIREEEREMRHCEPIAPPLLEPAGRATFALAPTGLRHAAKEMPQLRRRAVSRRRHSHTARPLQVQITIWPDSCPRGPLGPPAS